MVAKKQMLETCEVTSKRIKNFLNNEVKSYAQYVLRTRTMPNIMDGLRVGARKILYAAMTGDLSKRKFVKMPALIGDTMKLQYAHGDASLATTIVNLCCTHLNNYAPLEAIGQIPSLRVPKCDTAVRYLMIKKAPYLDWYTFDKELWEIQEEEGEKIEPTFFLPIIPMILLNRTSSPGFGFSFKSFSYKLEDIIDNVIQSITRGTCINNIDDIQLTPEIKGINPENIIFNSSKNQYYCVGDYEIDFIHDKLYIKDLPYNVSYETLEESLNKLKDRFVINDWINTSQNEKINYTVTFPKGRLKVIYDKNKWKFFQIFNLYSRIPKDILNCIDENGKNILFFETPYQLIDTFVQKRLKYYNERKTRTINYLKNQLEILTNKINFIEKVISGELVVFKRKKSEIEQDLITHKLPKYVLDMKMWNLTAEEIQELKIKKDETAKQLDYIIKTTIQEMYLNDIIEFRAKYLKIEKYGNNSN